MKVYFTEIGPGEWCRFEVHSGLRSTEINWAENLDREMGIEARRADPDTGSALGIFELCIRG